jgi:uncharacterized protein (TIGR00730 family)
MRIGISLTSSLRVGEEYIDLTKSVAQLLVENGIGVVYGGTDYGMMETLANSYKEAGGTELIGVMSKELEAVTKGYKAFEGLSEVFWVTTMGERIRTIADKSDGFLLLPGGYGTLEEMLSYVGGKANKLFDKPIILYNHNHFYDTLITFFDEMQSKGFSKIKLNELVQISTSIEDVSNYLQSYSSVNLPDKFI